MVRPDIPRGWKQVTTYAENISESQAFINHVKTFEETNGNTLHRVCMPDRPALLPGVFQNYDYTMAIFARHPHEKGKLGDAQHAAHRQGLWSTYLASGGNVEALIHPDALTNRLGSLTAGAMREALVHAWQVAQHPSVKLHIRIPGNDFAEQEQAGTWTLKYPNGPGEGAIVQPTVSVQGIESVLPIEQIAVPVMEKTWNILQENTYDANASLRILGDAIDRLPEE
jgi:hypothetical protein